MTRSHLMLPALILIVCAFSYGAYLLIASPQVASDNHQAATGTEQFEQSQPALLVDQTGTTLTVSTTDQQMPVSTPENLEEQAVQLVTDALPPNNESNYQLKDFRSEDFMVEGLAVSDFGQMVFNSELSPANEVKLTLTLKQDSAEDIQLHAYFDLAYFRMELDGGNSVLNKDHKQLLKLASQNLRPEFEQQYRDYDMPEHALMLVQMMEYWSVSPEGFVHEKREVVSR
jgi:hypothetical protein